MKTIAMLIITGLVLSSTGALAAVPSAERNGCPIVRTGPVTLVEYVMGFFKKCSRPTDSGTANGAWQSGDGKDGVTRVGPPNGDGELSDSADDDGGSVYLGPPIPQPSLSDSAG